VAKKRGLYGDAIKIKKTSFGYHPGRMAGLKKAMQAKSKPTKRMDD